MDERRTARLNSHLQSVLRGNKTVNSQQKDLFIEAVYSQTDPVLCINGIIASKVGLPSLQAAMRFDLGPAFLNGHATALLVYLQKPEIQGIDGGRFIDQVLLAIVEPPIFWSAFSRAFQTGILEANGQLCFAWLLLQLISLPGEKAGQYLEMAKDTPIVDTLLASSQQDMRTFGQKIKHMVEASNSGTVITRNDLSYAPGGRHDNDFADFREIAILPTADEISSKEPAFLRPSAALEDPETEGNRLATYLDNQFRLLREEMIAEVREELQIALGEKKGHRRGLVITGLKVLDLNCGPPGRRNKWGMTLQCEHDLPQLKKVKPKERKTYLTSHRKILGHQSLTCLIIDDKVVAFATIHRDEELLARDPPVIMLQLEGDSSIVMALTKMRTGGVIKLISVDTAVFSFEPVLKAIKETRSMPFSQELLLWKQGCVLEPPTSQATSIVDAIRLDPQRDLQKLLQLSKPIRLDRSQAASLLAGLTQRVSLIQGPPGTGKSFIGALLSKVIHNHTSQSILVVCYTNHALDQFLEDLLDIGIPGESMVRLGGKSTSRTESLSMQNQTSTFRQGKSDWMIIDGLKSEAEDLITKLQAAFTRYKSFTVQNADLLDYLEFEDTTYFEAFRVPDSTDDMTQVGKKGRAVDATYLLNQWLNGWDAGLYKKHSHVIDNPAIWEMLRPDRQAKYTTWKDALFEEQVTEFRDLAKQYNQCQNELARKFSEKSTAILRSKRIIGCTTTAAAKYSDTIQAAAPNVLLVEEAGEILESHVLTALGKDKDQLILIGDHKQLRPKVNNYTLTVEKGDGYDLNRSLFERLVLKGYPHETLNQQHRMRPEISALIRALTYPDLVDAAKTQNRPNLRGVQDNIVFINHKHPEDEAPQLSDRADFSSSSKQNTYEVNMVLKIVRYLGQQGYGTEKLVILTPYLGQLQNLVAALKKDNDPILNDLDSYELVRAGLIPAAAAQMSKKPIRLATIDNYQGEESDIVVVSLTRSNPNNDIGFMFAPERLNVLLSRARNALIMIGNADTFRNARKGKELWTQLFELLTGAGHIYTGFPIKCERHPRRTAIISQATDFDVQCPDGGCDEPCGTILNCGLHPCPFKCHQLSDHSRMQCDFILPSKCANGHDQSRKCHSNPPAVCPKCDRETKAAEKRQKEAFALKEKRDAEEAAHARELAEVERQIAIERQRMQDAQLTQDRANALRQKIHDLEVSRAAQVSSTSPGPANNLQPSGVSPTTGGHVSPTPDGKASGVSSPGNVSTSYLPTLGSLLSSVSSFLSSAPRDTSKVDPPNVSGQAPARTFDPIPESDSEKEWKRQKLIEGAANEAIDSIMSMIGLEDVKAQVLAIKAKIDTSKRQGKSSKSDRYNIVLLGNPGTGKTTVARHYAKFLSSVDVLPGDTFVETTGSLLAHEGVQGIQKKIEAVIKGGGGTIFVDEAYQLTGGDKSHTHQGDQVLDFLLAEMENNVGKLVFIFAGYNKQMEKFFEHNPGLVSRVPYSLQFTDYTDSELLSMLVKHIEKEFNGQMKMEGGETGLYCRIVVTRLGRGRGREGFGNARALHNTFAKIHERQAKRLQALRKDGWFANDFLLTKEDLIGPDPSEAIKKSSAWKKLQSLTGLKSVKQSIQDLHAIIKVNYTRDLQENKPIQLSLNRVFLGSPGTGKTTVAKLYGETLKDLGILSNGEVVVKNPADFIGQYIGQSETKTKAILASTVGKVLVIDEAYMLYGGGGGGNTDTFKTSVIDTIVAEVQSVPGDDRCVLLLGYKDQILDMFQNVNPGLSRRFAIEDAFHFEDFTSSELMEILNYKLKDQDLSATDAAKNIAIEVLNRARTRPNFGNAGEVENLLNQAKTRYQARQASMPPQDRGSPGVVRFEPQDFDTNFDRSAHASSNLQKLFEGVIGCEDIVALLGNYQKIAQTAKARGMDARKQIPMNFVFKGPPGTGKTTTARKMGQVFYDMGFLSAVEVHECSASDLVGQYVGHTGPKTKKVFEKALGRVLFIDEAYRLGEGKFAQEAMDELVGLLTHEKFIGKVVVILAGYDRDMNRLMGVNTGLSSRFPETITFRDMSPEHCLKLLDSNLKKNNIHLAALHDSSSAEYTEMVALVEKLSVLGSWGNARDMTTLSAQMTNFVLANATEPKPGDPPAMLSLSAQSAVVLMKKMLNERRERETNVSSRGGSTGDLPQMSDQNSPSPVVVNAAQNARAFSPRPPPKPRTRGGRSSANTPQNAPQPSNSTPSGSTTPTSSPPEMRPQPSNTPQRQPQQQRGPGRDPGVADEVWRQLQADKRAASEAAKRADTEIRGLQRALQVAAERERKQKAEAVALAQAQAQARDAAEKAELKRRHEEARLREIVAARERERKAAELRRRREEEARRKQQEAVVQTKLRSMGVCVAGFQWIRSGGAGYRCEGGTHFVSNATLGI